MMKNIFVFLLVLVSTAALAQESKLFSAGEGEVAFDGYDLTTYHLGEPIQGSDDFIYWHEGRIFKFASQENKDKFGDDPEKYLPAYGGWCATAMAQGFTAEPNYKMFEFQDGKLLFFEVKAFFNGKTQWLKDPDNNTEKATLFYEKLKSR